MVVSGCAEVVTSWQTGLSHPMHPSGQNSSHGQSQIVIYSLEITKFLIFSDNNKDFELTANAISSIPKTFSQTSRVVVAAIKKSIIAFSQLTMQSLRKSGTLKSKMNSIMME